MADYQNPYISDPYPGATQSAIDARRKYAMSVLQQGTDSSPTKANAIGAIARALQGAMGGYFAGQADQSDAADKANLMGIVQKYTGGAPSGQQADATAPVTPVSDAPVQAADGSMPRGLRNNNPLNIEAGGFTQSQPGFSGSDGRFAQFQTPEQGVQAANALLDSYGRRGLNTPAGIVGRWAPSTDGNNVSSYASDVAGKLGIGPNDQIPPQMRPQLIAAMASHENGRPMAPQDVAQMLQSQQGGQPQTQLAGPVPTPDSAPPQVAQAPTGQQAPQPSQSGDPRASMIAQLLSTRSGQQLGTALAAKMMEQQIAPPEFKQTGQTVLGQPQYGWVNPNKQTVTPIGQDGVAGSQGAAATDPSFATIASKVANGATPDQVYQHVPTELRGAVQSVIEGRGVPSNIGTRGAARTAVMLYAHAVDPSFDEALIPQRMTFARSMGSTAPSSVGGQKVLMGTSLGHLADLSDSAVDMGNVNGLSLAPLAHFSNSVMNQGTDQAAKALALEDKAQKFSGEVGKLYSGSSGGGVHEREETRSRMGADKSSAELASGLEANRDLILSKLQALEQQRDDAFGAGGKNRIEFQTPQVKAALAKIEANIAKLRGGGAQTDQPGQPAAPSGPLKSGTYNWTPQGLVPQ